MKSFKFGRMAVLMAAAEAATSTGAASAESAAAESAAVPESTTPDAAAAKTPRAPKDPAKVLNIINGRMPLPLVFCIRFKEPKESKAADIAKAYGTSVGKVFDIRKGSNFGYITESYKPSAEELTAARAFITEGTSTKGQTLKDLGGTPDAIEAHLASLTIASAEEVASRGWVIKAVGEAKPVDPNAPVVAKAPRKPKAAAAPAAPVAGNNASMF